MPMLLSRPGNKEMEVDGMGSKMASDRQTEDKRPQSSISLHYGIDDNPPWHICLLLGFQVSNCKLPNKSTFRLET